MGRLSLPPFSSGTASAPWLGLALTSLGSQHSWSCSEPSQDPTPGRGREGQQVLEPRNGDSEMNCPNLQYSHLRGGQADIWSQINLCQAGCDPKLGCLFQAEGINSGIVPPQQEQDTALLSVRPRKNKEQSSVQWSGTSWSLRFALNHLLVLPAFLNTVLPSSQLLLLPDFPKCRIPSTRADPTRLR